MTVDPAVLKQVSDELQLYVYMLVDPRNGIPFYVGKGQGIRAHAHLAEAMIEIDEDDEERSRKGAAIRTQNWNQRSGSFDTDSISKSTQRWKRQQSTC